MASQLTLLLISIDCPHLAWPNRDHLILKQEFTILQ
jgi:hypothetical protein